METNTEQSKMEEARRAKGWTLRQLAAAIQAFGVRTDHSNLSKIERGKVSPGPGLKRAIADVLGIQQSDLP